MKQISLHTTYIKFMETRFLFELLVICYLLLCLTRNTSIVIKAFCVGSLLIHINFFVKTKSTTIDKQNSYLHLFFMLLITSYILSEAIHKNSNDNVILFLGFFTFLSKLYDIFDQKYSLLSEMYVAFLSLSLICIFHQFKFKSAIT